MIISLYGISKSGKDFTIEKLLEKSKENSLELKHIKGSKTLNTLSKNLFNKNFKELCEDDQTFIRKEFIKYVKNLEKSYKNIIVDGHFSFPNGKNFNIVFTEEDLNLYDVFFYLNKSPQLVVKNCSGYNEHQFYDFLSSENNINLWKDFEISEMKKILNTKDKEFIVLDDSTSTVIEFMYKYIFENLILSSRIDKIIQDSNILKYNNIILTDLDKTISINDLTLDFITHSNLIKSKVKDIFRGDYYTSFQSYKFHKYLKTSLCYDSALEKAIKNIKMNFSLIQNLKTKKNSIIVGITTGMGDAWENINEKYKILNFIIGKNTTHNNNYNVLVSQQFKGLLAKKLISLGKNICSIGDSIVDFEMLQYSNIGVLISMEKIDKRIEKKLELYMNENLVQPRYNNFKYKNIKEVDEI